MHFDLTGDTNCDPVVEKSAFVDDERKCTLGLRSSEINSKLFLSILTKDIDSPKS
tara:strand:+ start:115 stop:279 length:165 start_codon:yes stop_codon:yes gene_type:complete